MTIRVSVVRLSLETYIHAADEFFVLFADVVMGVWYSDQSGHIYGYHFDSADGWHYDGQVVIPALSPPTTPFYVLGVSGTQVS